MDITKRIAKILREHQITDPCQPCSCGWYKPGASITAHQAEHIVTRLSLDGLSCPRCYEELEIGT